MYRVAFRKIVYFFELVHIIQVAKKTAQKSKTLLTDFERWQKVCICVKDKLLKYVVCNLEIS